MKPSFPAAEVRTDFPLLSSVSANTDGKRLIYFDNAASSQRHRAAIERLDRFYREENSNIHRGVHRLSQAATEAYEQARRGIAGHLGVEPQTVVFTRNATESINLVASSYGRRHLPGGSWIAVTEMEHHANIVPWQLLAEELGFGIVAIPVLPNGELDRAAYRKVLEEKRPALVALNYVSNALGTINPARELIAEAHEAGAKVMLDGAQALPHFPVNLKELDCDFFAFSGHKVFGPTGIGVLYGKYELLESMPPYQGGGDMIVRVSFSGTTYREPPERFEAGTPHISGAIGLEAAMSAFAAYDHAALGEYEHALRLRLEAGLREIPGLRIVGEAPDKVAVTSFLMDGVHSHDVATFLDADGIAVRAGHHCAMPLMEALGIAGTVRASLAFYNTEEEVDQFVRSVSRIRKFFV